MNKKIIIIIVAVLLLICIGVIIAVVALFINKPVSTQPGTDTTVTCAITNCHGLDIICGTNPPQACTEIYELGDGCRQFAKCGMQDNACQLIENSNFSICRSCVEECIDTFPDDQELQMSCEGGCVEALQ